jgi:OmpA-OmpF porin, OOP family
MKFLKLKLTTLTLAFAVLALLFSSCKAKKAVVTPPPVDTVAKAPEPTKVEVPIDTDGDGIPDSKDACPNEKGTSELNGCPAPVIPPFEDTTLLFEFNSSVLKTSAYSVLDKAVANLKANTVSGVQLDGYASNEGTDEHNLQLSKDRAEAVKTYLVNAGVDAGKVSTKGYGEAKPVASNKTEDGRILNRRVEVKKQ